MSDEGDERPSFGGLGFSRGGLGATTFQTATNDSSQDDNEGYESPRKRPRLDDTAGIRTARSDGVSKPKAGGGGSSFAERMMAQMGWKKGEGLGTKGHGRLAPVDAMLRPQKIGLGAVREKSKQAKEEEKRAAALRGEKLEDSSEEERKRKKSAKEARKKAGVQTSTTPRVRKTKYITAEEVKADLVGLDLPENVLQTVYDLAGKQVEATGTGFVAAQTPSDPAAVEAQRAATLIRRELLACAESRHGLNERRDFLDDSSSHVVENVDQLREDVQISKEILTSIEALGSSTHPQAVASDVDVTITELTEKLEGIEIEHKDHLSGFDLPEVAVAALHPSFRTAMLHWEPFEQPNYLTESLSRLKAILGIEDRAASSVLTRKEDLQTIKAKRKKATTPYETMIYQLWLPRVRQAVTSSFNVAKPQPLEELLTAWRPLLPAFVYSNIINQLLVPRLISAIREWKPSRPGRHHHHRHHGPSPDQVVFSWLPFLPERHLDPHSSTSLLSDVRRKLRSLLSSHSLESGIPAWLTPWKTLLGSASTTLLTTHLLPRLASYLSARLVIDPGDQNLDAFETVLLYQDLFSTSTMAELFSAHFFPKFHNLLHEWLTSGQAETSEVEMWIQWWREQFPQAIRETSAISIHFDKAYATVAAAHELGDRVEDLPMPETVPGHGWPSKTQPANGRDGSGRDPNGHDRPEAATTDHMQLDKKETTFRDVVEDWCAENDVLLVALREARPETGEPLYRVTARADQKGGAVVCLSGESIVVREKAKDGDKTWRPIALGEELVRKAEGR